MKKSMIMTCLTLMCMACAFAGCATSETSTKDGYYNNEEIVVGGGDVSTDVSISAVLIGAGEIYLKKTATKADLDLATASVRAQKGTESFPVSVNTDSVQFGVQGTYKIVYSYENIQEEYNVYIYGDMQAGATNETAVSFSYSTAYIKLTDGVTFTDSFGMALETQVLSDGGMMNKDGSLNIGTFTVEYMAMDKAGQSLVSSRQVTVAEERTPALTDQTYDMADDGLCIQPESVDYDVFLGISINGLLLSSEDIRKENGEIFINGDAIYAIAGNTGVQTLRYLSSKGYKDVTLTLTDEKTVAIEDTALRNFAKGYYACNATYFVPSILLTNKRQQETPVVKLYKNGSEVLWNGKQFEPIQDGNYELRITVRGEEYIYRISTYYDLGLAEGMVFTQADGIRTYFDEEKYELIECRVRSLDKTKTHVLYKKGSSDFDNLDTFDNGLRALNKNGSYYLSVIAKDRAGKEYSQQVRFMVAGEYTQSILSVKADVKNSHVTPNESDHTSIGYASEEIAGKRGIFRWEGLTDKATDNYGMLLFNQKFLGEDSAYFKKDTYIAFEMYVDGGRCLPVFCVDGKWYHEFYSGGGENIKFYDETGNLLSGSYVDGTLCNRWVTVEVKLHADMSFTQYNGLSFWSDAWGGSQLKGRNVYLANVRVSTESLVSDTTKNTEISTGALVGDEEILFTDVWADKKKLY